MGNALIGNGPLTVVVVYAGRISWRRWKQKDHEFKATAIVSGQPRPYKETLSRAPHLPPKENGPVLICNPVVSGKGNCCPIKR